MSWDDVGPTSEGIGTNTTLAVNVVASAGKLNHPPAIYLGGLLLVAANEPQKALAAFERIPVVKIPPPMFTALTGCTMS